MSERERGRQQARGDEKAAPESHDCAPSCLGSISKGRSAGRWRYPPHRSVMPCGNRPNYRCRPGESQDPLPQGDVGRRLVVWYCYRTRLMDLAVWVLAFARTTANEKKRPG